MGKKKKTNLLTNLFTMKNVFLTVLIVFTLIACSTKGNDNQDNDLTKYVNPFIGNAFTGHTFPGATYPLGLIQAGAQTGNFTWQYCAGYVYEDSIINGFTQTRLNGTGCVDLGDLLVQPFSGEMQDDFNSNYDKSSEKASPGYYAVNLLKNKVNVEITAAPHVAFHKYKFEKDKTANIYIDFQSGLTWREDKVHHHILDHELNFVDNKTITGFTRRTEWVERVYYFVIKFDKPIVNKIVLPQKDEREKANRYVFTFDTEKGDEVNMKVALSSTSIAGAEANLSKEVPEWNFEKVKKEASTAWNNYLSRVKIEGTDDEKSNFYTAIYHLFIQPNNIADIDGKYIGPNREISQSSSGKHYSTLSQWDTFRAAFPMYTIMSPEIVPDLVNSMLDFSEQQGHLPIWGLWGQETYTMIGNHSIPMIADAYLKGFTGFDVERAYREMKKSITESKHPKSDWKEYDQYGYFPYDLVKLESVSRTLECGFDDYCMAQMAKKMGKSDDYNFFNKRADYYKNLFDKETNSMRPKNSKGEWLSPFDPYELAHADSEVGGHYTEANALQYTWHVLQDIPGLINLMGGKEKALKTLDYLFNTKQEATGTLSDVTGLIGQYAHGNEPSHHIAYIYPYLDKPQETQRLVRYICSNFYKNKPDGLMGNDDCGQMSAWYMFSVMGFYPLNPVSGEFVLGAPQVSKIQISVGNGKQFTVEAKNLSDKNMFVEKIELNGKPHTQKTISYKDIMNGSTLVFYMTEKGKQ